MPCVTDRLTLASKESNLGLKLNAYQGYNDDKHIQKITLTLFPNSNESDMSVEFQLSWPGFKQLLDTLKDFQNECEMANDKATRIKEATEAIKNV